LIEGLFDQRKSCDKLGLLYIDAVL